MQQIQIIGHVGQDAKSQVVSGRTVVFFSLAVNEKYKSDGEPKERTTWYDCSIWRNEDNLSKHIVKGSLLWIQGKPNVKQYTNQAGENKFALQVIVQDFKFISSPNQSPVSAASDSNDVPY
jgi:single-strand DNA-binding protein